MRFEEFAQVCGPALLRAAVLLTGETQAAEDLVQDTLTKLYVRWRRLSHVDDPIAYARVAMTRTYISQRRRRSSGERPTGHVADISASDDDVSLRLSLADALARLEPLDRAVLVLRFFEDRSAVQVAADLRLSPGAVRNRTMRALDRIRPHVAGLDGRTDDPHPTGRTP